MKQSLFALIASAVLFPAAASAQFVNIRLELPEVPPLVVVSPGIQVVENHDEEIFFHDGWYWARRDGHWYRAHSPRHEFVYVEHQGVPRALYGLPAGRYRHFHHEAFRDDRRVHEEEARLREREMRQREEERRLHQREEAEHRREAERRREEAERHREVRHEEHREVRHEAQHEEHRDVHPAAPAPPKERPAKRNDDPKDEREHKHGH